MRKLIIVLLFSNILLTCPAQDNRSNSDKFYVEDVIEWIPTAAIFGMKACGVDSKSTFTQQLAITGAAFVVNVAVVEALKHTVHSERPDHSDNKGFPSGHAAISFMGADILFEEYKDVSPWIGIGGYGIATTTSILRVTHDRHHWLDVIGGAAIGVGASRLSQWLTPKIFKFKNHKTQVYTTPSLYENGMGLDLTLRF